MSCIVEVLSFNLHIIRLVGNLIFPFKLILRLFLFWYTTDSKFIVRIIHNKTYFHLIFL